MFDDPLKLLFVCGMVFLAGLIDSIAGGGGLISLPAFLSIGLPPHIAFGCNKFSSSFGTTISAFRFFKNGVLDLKISLVAAAASFIGSTIASRFVLLLDSNTLKKLLVIVIPIAAFIVLFKVRGSDNKPAFDLAEKKRVVRASVAGIILGLYDGLIGPGTGTFAILAFTGFMGYELRMASGNAKILNLASNYASMLAFIIAGSVDYRIALPAAASCIAGHYIGAGLAIHKGAKFIRPTMLGVLTLLMIKIIWDMVAAA